MATDLVSRTKLCEPIPSQSSLQEENDTEHMETCDELNLEIHCDSLESDDLLISSNRGAENSTIEREHDGTLRSEMIPCPKGDSESTRHNGRPPGVCMEVGSDESRQEACESIMDISKFKKYSIDLRERIETSRITLPENLSETTPVDKAAKTIAFCLREVFTLQDLYLFRNCFAARNFVYGCVYRETSLIHTLVIQFSHLQIPQ